MEGRGKESKSTQHDSALAKNILWTWLFRPVLQILHANYSSLPLFGQNSFLYTARSDYSLTLVEKKLKWKHNGNGDVQHPVMNHSTCSSVSLGCTAGGSFRAQLGEVFLLSWSMAWSALPLSRAHYWRHAKAGKAIFSICSWFFPYSVYGALPSLSRVQGLWLCLAPTTRVG